MVMNSFLIALQFLTRLSVVNQSRWTEQDFGESVKHFPAVGAVLGIICALVVGMLNSFTDGNVPLFTGAIGFAVSIILTGGIHCDGLMDSADGLLSGRERDKMLEIMKDSRAGSFGVLSMILVAAIDVAALAELARLSTWWLCAAVYSAPIIGRLMMVLTIGLFPYARPEGMGKAFAMFTTRRTMLLAAMEAFVLLVPLSFFNGVFSLGAMSAILITFAITWGVANFAEDKIGGVTGDVYGAVTMLAELFTLITFLLSGNYLR